MAQYTKEASQLAAFNLHVKETQPYRSVRVLPLGPGSSIPYKAVSHGTPTNAQNDLHQPLSAELDISLASRRPYLLYAALSRGADLFLKV